MTAVTVNVEVTVPMERVFEVWVNAFDSGACAYWVHSVAAVLPQDFTPRDLAWLSDAAWWCDASAGRSTWRYFAPFVEGGRVRFGVVRESAPAGCAVDDLVVDYHDVDLEKMRRGVQTMADKCPRHFGDLVSGDDDATTADVLVQCVVFGEVLYG